MLDTDLDRPDLDWHRAERPRRRVGRRLELHRSIGSTNDRARELLDEPDGEGTAVLAEEQTAGRGRRGRGWSSPAGLNLTLSVAIRPSVAAPTASMIAIAAGLAARTACARYASAWLKWPNDVVAGDGAKLGGLLVETTVEGERLSSAVIGIGLNVNWHRSTMPAEIAAGATSLADLAGHPIDRVALLGSLLDELDAELTALESGASPLDRYRVACATLGTDVTVETATGPVAGRAVDVDATGGLVVEGSAGRTTLTSGEIVRLRPRAPA
jgi:BirA family biotin operon repressor/biotin-[acetyl-CoA-carboxylase] ligase